MESLPNALAGLQGFNQFVLWKSVPSTRRPGKFDKFPCNIEGSVSDAHDPLIWLDADTACAGASLLGDGYGVGFVFTENDPFFFVDIDGAYDGVQWSSLATGLCNQFTGAAVEVSHSGTGLHIIGEYAGGEPQHGCKNIPLGLEFYTSGRFVALTGTGITGDAWTNHTGAITDITRDYFPLSTTERSDQDWTTTNVSDSRPPTDDVKLIEKAPLVAKKLRK